MLVRHFILPLAVTLGFLYVDTAFAKTTRYTDEQIKQLIIEDAIAAYPGTCACPFNSARNGSRCGRRSAWSKAGGYAPVCFKQEVTKEMVNEWRQSHNA